MATPWEQQGITQDQYDAKRYIASGAPLPTADNNQGLNPGAIVEILKMKGMAPLPSGSASLASPYSVPTTPEQVAAANKAISLGGYLNGRPDLTYEQQRTPLGIPSEAIAPGSTTYGPGTWSNGVKTAEWTDPATGAKTPAGVGMPSNAFATPAFKDGLSQAQKDSITQLSHKPINQWTQTDKNNWNYATNNSALPGNPASPKLATLTSPTGEKRVVTVGSQEASQLLSQSWTLGDKVGGGTVTSGLLTPTTPINIGGTTTKTANDASVIQAGADATSKAVDEEIKRLTELQTPPETPLSKEVQALMDELKLGAETLTGRGAAQKSAEEQRGIAEKQAALAAKNTELKTKLAEIKSLDASYQLANQTEEGRPQTLSRLQGAQAQNYKMYLAQRNTLTADAGYMQAELLGIQGQLDSAQAAADRAVDLEYTDRESAYNAKIAKLNILKPQLEKEEAKYAAALKVVLDNQASAVAEEKQNKKDLMSLIVQAAGNGAPQSIISQMKAAPDVLSATQIANKWIKGTLETATKAGAGGSSGGSGTGGGVKTKIYNASTIPTDLKTELINNIANGASKNEVYQAYGDVSTSYIDSLFKNVEPAPTETQSGTNNQNNNQPSNPSGETISQGPKQVTWWNPLTWF